MYGLAAYYLIVAQLLLCASFVAASVSDVRERAVSDLVWIPAVAGAVISLYFAGGMLGFYAVKVALIGGVGLAFAYFGAVGEADAIALVLVSTDPDLTSPVFPLVGAAVVALSHIVYEYAVGNARGNHTIPIDQFLREQRWIPKAIVANGVRTEVSSDVNVAREEVEARQSPGATVEVSYGVPTVAYIGAGYVLFLLWSFALHAGTFAALP